jgi:hypothetical protein
MLNRKEARIFRKITGWDVGNKCAVQLKTKKVYGTIIDIKTAHVIGKPPKPKGRRPNSFTYAVVEYECKGKPAVPHRQDIPLWKLLEDDRD